MMPPIKGKHEIMCQPQRKQLEIGNLIQNYVKPFEVIVTSHYDV